MRKRKKPAVFVSAGLESYDCAVLALTGLRRHVRHVVMMVMAVDQRKHAGILVNPLAEVNGKSLGKDSF